MRELPHDAFLHVSKRMKGKPSDYDFRDMLYYAWFLASLRWSLYRYSWEWKVYSFLFRLGPGR